MSYIIAFELYPHPEGEEHVSLTVDSRQSDSIILVFILASKLEGRSSRQTSHIIFSDINATTHFQLYICQIELLIEVPDTMPES